MGLGVETSPVTQLTFTGEVVLSCSLLSPGPLCLSSTASPSLTPPTFRQVSMPHSFVLVAPLVDVLGQRWSWNLRNLDLFGSASWYATFSAT